MWLCWVYDAITNLAPLRLHAALAPRRRACSRSSGRCTSTPSYARPLAGRPPHARAASSPTTTTTPTSSSRWGCSAGCGARRADIYRPLRNALVLTNVIALRSSSGCYPVAPPRMLGGLQRRRRHRRTRSAPGTPARSPPHANQFAAMPSLHMAWAVWCALVLWRLSATRRGCAPLAVLYPCMTAFAVLATGNHFVLDVLAGAGDAARWRCLSGADASAKCRPARVAHVTNLLRSLIPGRLNPSSQAVHKR